MREIHWWNNTDRRNLEDSEKSLSQCHFPPLIPYGLDLDRLLTSLTNRLNHGTAYSVFLILHVSPIYRSTSFW